MRNPIKIRDPRFKLRVIKSKKIYSRKGRKKRPFSFFNNGVTVSK
jgi:hypothetical protein